jgi:hypothetical protein
MGSSIEEEHLNDVKGQKLDLEVRADEGLGNRVLLDKIDKLRELHVGTSVGLPQV